MIIVLEVYQFARDAAVAEAWLIAQEPYLMSQELGVSEISLMCFINIMPNVIYINQRYF